MGFFSEIVNEARRGQLQQPTPQAFPAPMPAASAETDGRRPGAPVRPAAQAAPSPQPEHEPEPEPKSKPEPEHEPPAIDLTPGARAEDDAAKRRAHEAAEAKRKAEFDAKQAERKAARQKQLDRIAAMDGAELLAAAADRVATDTERLTRRNMKEAVAGHIQAKCRSDAAFAMLVMDPDKSMASCFRYINRMAQAYAEQEMKDNGIQRTGVYGLDVPDGLCYQWAEDYFNDPDAKEDHKDDEEFVPKPYAPTSANRKKAQGKTAEKPVPAEKPKAGKPAADAGMEQLSLI